MTDRDDLIDLRKYFLILIQHWRRLVIVTVIFAGTALIFKLVSERKYESTVTILVTRSRVALILADQFPTLNEPIDSVSRMNAINSIIQSDSIFSKTFNSMVNQLPQPDEDLFTFRNRLTLNTIGDAIQITASAESPGLAATIANTWADFATSAVNSAYTGNQPLTEVSTQLGSAKSEFETAQANLELFIQDNQIELLTRQISESRTLLDNLTGMRAWRINYYAERARYLEQLILEAEGLRSQFEQGSISEAARLGDVIALFNLRAFSLGINTNPQVSVGGRPLFPNQEPPPITLDLQLIDPAGLLDVNENITEDLESVVEIAESEIAKALEKLDILTDEIFDPETAIIYLDVADKLQDLESQLERETARQLALKSDRDLTWEAYQAIAEKEVEIRNSVQTETLVSIASDAIPPTRPVPRGTLITTLFAAAIGMLITVSVTLLIDWWRTN